MARRYRPPIKLNRGGPQSVINYDIVKNKRRRKDISLNSVSSNVSVEVNVILRAEDEIKHKIARDRGIEVLMGEFNGAQDKLQHS